MNFLKNLFGGGSQTPVDRNGMYIYVQPKRCEEIVEVRINLMNDLSRKDEGNGYFVRKMVSATRCPFQAEVTIEFDNQRNVISQEAENGEIVDAAAYQRWVASQGNG